jgi:hypothetical protein
MVERVVVVTEHRRLAGGDELVQVLVIVRRRQLPRLGIIGKEVDVRPRARVQFLDQVRDHGQAFEAVRRRLVAKVIPEDGGMIAHLLDRCRHVRARLGGIDVVPVVVGQAGVGDDRLEPRGPAVVQRIGMNEARHRQPTLVHPLEHR